MYQYCYSLGISRCLDSDLVDLNLKLDVNKVVNQDDKP